MDALVHEHRIIGKATLRLVPFLCACYITAFLDRVNVGFAALQMQSDLRFSDTVYSFGAGIFFIGYFLLEVPAALFLGFWFLFQLWEGGFSLVNPQEGGGVAFFAHIGGFVFGVTTVRLFSKRPPLQPVY